MMKEPKVGDVVHVRATVRGRDNLDQSDPYIRIQTEAKHDACCYAPASSIVYVSLVLLLSVTGCVVFLGISQEGRLRGHMGARYGFFLKILKTPQLVLLTLSSLTTQSNCANSWVWCFKTQIQKDYDSHE